MLLDYRKFEKLRKILRDAYAYDRQFHCCEMDFLLVQINHNSQTLQQENLSFYPTESLEIRRDSNYNVGVYDPNFIAAALFFEHDEKTHFIKAFYNSFSEVVAYYTEVLFHELAHYYDDDWRRRISMHEIMYNVFCYDVLKFIRQKDRSHYKQHHDEYLSEILADEYGAKTAYEFLESRGLLTPEGKSLLKNIECRSAVRYNNFDLHDFLHLVDVIVRKNDNIDLSKEWFLSLFYAELDEIDKLFIYLGLGGSRYKSIDKILELAKEWKVAPIILNCFFSSNDFLDALDFSSLSLEHKKVIINAIEWALNYENERRKENQKFLKNRQITSEEYSTFESKISAKMEYYRHALDEFKQIMLSSDEKAFEDEEDPFKI